MSEDFDKEAERERLREKYEAEQEDREATERMSELLLQGATMTNKHCDTCGSPIFRYQGREFCPTCQEERGQAAQEAARTEGEEAAGAAQAAAGAAGDEAAGAGRGADQAAATEGRSESEAAPSDSPGVEGAGPGASTGTAETGRTETPASGTGQARPASRASARPAQGGQPAASLDEARASLVRTITSLTRRAEATEDPRQARDLLEAAREAAETLATLQGSR